MVFLFVASFIERSVGFDGKCDMTRMNVRYRDIVVKVVVDHRKLQCVGGELSGLRREIEEYKRVVYRVCALHCPSGWSIISFHPLDNLVEDLESLVSMAFTEVALFENYSVLNKQSQRTTPRRLSKEYRRLCRAWEALCAECKELNMEHI